jgi:hypothetical protein
MKNEGRLDEIREALANDRDEAMRKRRVFRGRGIYKKRRVIELWSTRGRESTQESRCGRSRAISASIPARSKPGLAPMPVG